MKIEKYKILFIPEDIEKDPLWFKYCSILFDLANKLGLKGTQVSNLEFAHDRDRDPLNVCSYFSCNLEVGTITNKKLLKAFNETQQK